MGMQFVSKIPGKEWVVGAHFINMQMFKLNLKSGKIESSLNKVSHHVGQVDCGTTLDNKFYFGSYTKAVLNEYDIEDKFIYGQNPKIISYIKKNQNRPVAMANDGKCVYIATVAGYGLLGGALSVLDPQTKKIETYRHFVKDQNPTSMLYYHQESNCLIGGTWIHADCKTHAPTAENAVIFMWDVSKHETLHTSYPWKSERIEIMSISPGGVAIGKEDDKYFLYNIGSKKYEIKDWPVPGLFIGGLFMTESLFYGAAEHGLFCLDTKTNAYTMLSKTTKETGSYIPGFFEKISDNEFLFDIVGSKLMKATIVV